MAPITWRMTKPDADLDYRCDLCGTPANTVHFLRWISECTDVVFACREHDPGGYWMSIRDLVEDDGQPHNNNHWDALTLMSFRVEYLRFVEPPAGHPGAKTTVPDYLIESMNSRASREAARAARERPPVTSSLP